MTSSVTGFSSLKTETLLHIKGFLSKEEARVLPCVCKMWKGRLEKQISLPERVDFSDPKTLSEYMDPSCKTKKMVQAAMEVASRIYEANVRPVAGSKYGQVFAMNPEVLALAMQQVKGKKVLELGAASGEHSILMAFAGAKQVFVNDLEPTEIATFESLRKKIPSEVGKKLVSLPGDCLKVLDKNSDLAGKIDLILCRNLIHFFNKKQEQEFFKLVKQMLAPGGEAIFVVNSVYSQSFPEIHKAHPQAVCFSRITVGLIDYAKGKNPIGDLYTSITPCELPVDTDDLLSFKDFYLYTRNIKAQFGSFKWEVHQENFQTIDAIHRPEIQEAIKGVKKLMGSIQVGSVRVLLNTLKLYSQSTLRQLFEDQGFTVRSTFVETLKGHILPATQDPFKGGQQMGIIVKLS